MANSQDALYAGIDLDLSWSERELPERERTKHVHRLHPYLGKFIPQLVEVLLSRYVVPGGRVLDPFAGSGTTLVQSLESGYDAAGGDLAAFNCLLMRVKTARYNEFTLEKELRDAVGRHESLPDTSEGLSLRQGYVGQWFAPQAAAELLAWRELVEGYEHADVMQVVLARAARSARLTTHFDLDFPRTPQREPYWCHKHRRTCRPIDRASHFLRRYALDTLARIKQFARVRARGREAVVLHGDSQELEWGGPFDAVLTSPPYPGLIDYHEQHRYADELLGLAAYTDGIAATLSHAADVLRPGAPLLIVVNDRRDLYPEILERAGLRVEERLRRHVNRRTGRRAGEFFEDVLVARV
jgi:hypothetical protein